MPSYWQTYTIIGCDFPVVFQLPSHSIQVWLALDIIKTRLKMIKLPTQWVQMWTLDLSPLLRRVDNWITKNQTERVECIKWHDDFYHCCCSWLMTSIVYSTLGSCTPFALVMKGSDLVQHSSAFSVLPFSL